MYSDNTVSGAHELPPPPVENCYLIDWLSFRCESMTFRQMQEYLGLLDADWQIGPGFYHYKLRYWCGGISIHYGSEECTGVLVEMSGSGCRTYETAILRRCSELTAVDIWREMFTDILSNDNFVVTRLDVAFDDHTGVFPMQRMIYDFRRENFCTKFKAGRGSRSCKLEMSPHDTAATIYFGSPQSEIRFRIYDKSAERGYSENVHWIRFEIQMRRDNAFSFIRHLVDSGFDLPTNFIAVVQNYLRFVVPDKNDSNKRRWKMRRYWADFVGDVAPKSLWKPKTTEYNKKKCEDYVFGMAGNSVHALIELDGLEDFAAHLEQRRSKHVSQKIRDMIDAEKRLKNVGNFVDSLTGDDENENDGT